MTTGGDTAMEREPVEVRMLGPVEVFVEGRRLDVVRDAHRRLLSFLALAGGGRISTEQLIDRFWNGDPPPTAKTALQTHISAVRRQLPADAIVTEGRGYRLGTDVVRVDAAAFAGAARAARSALDRRAWHDALAHADRALQLWRGEPYAELPDDAEAIAERATLDGLHASSVEGRAEALVGLGRLDEAVPELERLVQDHPFRERGWELLASARWRLGRTAEALRAIHDAGDALAEVGLVPGHGLREVERQILADEQRSTPSSNLPNPLTSFVGRTSERAEVGDHVRQNRLVTVTGVGGTGKSRLAIETARDLLDLGVFAAGSFVELASIDDPAQVPAVVAAAVGAPDDGRPAEDAIIAAVGADQHLLVLDNCEHLVDQVAALVRFVLEAAPGVKVLATSRVNLGLTGELVSDLPPLASTAPDGVEPDRLDAVRLFVDRARLARPDLRVGAGDMRTIANLCAALDGLPLAIELAAARVRSLDLSTILDRTTDRLKLLRSADTSVPERQRTIEATIAWSYDLLDHDEQRVLERLAVFRSAVDLTAITAVCSVDDLDVETHLDRLVAHSLVSVRPAADGYRYELLWTVREFAWNRAIARGDADDMIQRHLDHFTSLALDKSCANNATLTPLDLPVGVPLDDVRAALEHARAVGDARATMLLAGLLGRIAEYDGRPYTAIDIIEIALTGDAGIDETRSLRALHASIRAETDHPEGLPAIEALLDEMADDPPSAVRSGIALRAAAVRQETVDADPEPAIDLYRRSLADACAVGHTAMELRTRLMLAKGLGWIGRDDEAFDEIDGALEAARRLGDPMWMLRAHDAAIGVYFLTDRDRRNGPRRHALDGLELADELDTGGILPVDWLPYALLQAEEYDGAIRTIDMRVGGRGKHLEASGFKNGWHTVRAYAFWWRGDVEAAWVEIDAASPHLGRRYYHDFYPVAAEVARERGDLATVRRFANDYLSADVDNTEEPLKFGVLRPLVHGLVDSALDGDSAACADEARSTVAWMRDVVARTPLESTVSVQVETPAAWFALAEAELTRFDDDPLAAERAWHAAADLAAFPWYIRYAERRLAEATARRS